MIKKKFLLPFALILIIHLISCATEFGMTVISKPDEHTHVYEAKEKIILKAIASVLKEKSIGNNVIIDEKNNRVDSDFVVSDNWRTKTTASVKRLNWKECEVSLIVTTEKKTKKGWELRRLLGKEQYDSFFSVIDLKIYEEMSKIQ
ncbi:MAG: hypothetical protein Q8O28_07800 [Smithellaceae bacterium]|nr:hypothetical protein [Smithellaceae bacterium]